MSALKRVIGAAREKAMNAGSLVTAIHRLFNNYLKTFPKEAQKAGIITSADPGESGPEPHSLRVWYS
jgi:hypothetical protein